MTVTMTPKVVSYCRDIVSKLLERKLAQPITLLADAVQQYGEIGTDAPLEELFFKKHGYPISTAINHALNNTEPVLEGTVNERLQQIGTISLTRLLKLVKELSEPLKVLTDSLKPALQTLIGTNHEAKAKQYSESIGVSLAAA